MKTLSSDRDDSELTRILSRVAQRRNEVHYINCSKVYFRSQFPLVLYINQTFLLRNWLKELGGTEFL